MSKSMNQFIQGLVNDGLVRDDSPKVNPNDPLPSFSVAHGKGHVNAHGHHADGLARTSYGSHQIRVDTQGDITADKHNFNNDEFGRRVGFDANADPRATGMGGWNPRKY